MPKKLILDVDTGTDDAVALMLAALHPDLELVAATTVNGNNPVEYCTDNTLRVIDLLDRDIPVFEGQATPMTRDDFPIPRRGDQREGRDARPRAADPAATIGEAGATRRRLPRRHVHARRPTRSRSCRSDR